MEEKTEIKATEADEKDVKETAGRDLDAEFAELIRGEYKAAFNAKVKEILVRRFRGRAEAANGDNGEKAGCARHDDENAADGAPLPAGQSGGAAAVDPAEAAKLARLYPETDVAAAIADPEIVRLRAAGLTLREAYEFANREELAGSMVRQAENAAYERARSELIAGGRLSEAQRTGGSVALSGVERLTLAEREALERRALQGEKIVL